jgi:hypothetical protein
MTFQPDAPAQPEQPTFGSTCTCGEWEKDGVTHRVGESCTVDETGEVYGGLPKEAPDTASATAGDDADSDALSVSFETHAEGLSGDDDTADSPEA